MKFSKAPSAGHRLVVTLWNNGRSTGAANTYTPPSGWTLVSQNTSHAYMTYQTFTHVVASGESNYYQFAPAAAQREHVWIAADATASSIDKSVNAYVSGSKTFTTPSLTPAYANDIALAFNLPDTTSSVSWTNAYGWTLGSGPTTQWRGESLVRVLSSTSAVSESSTLSGAASGFTALVLLSPSQAYATPAPVTTATPAPSAPATPAPSATATPTAAPVSGAVATYHGCRLYPANDWFTTNLVSGGSSYVPNTVDPNSANIINNLAAVNGNINFNANVVPTEEGVNVDTGSNVVATPTISGLSYGFSNDPSNDDPSPYKVPVTSGTFMQEGTSTTCTRGDCHVIVLKTSNCVDYETYRFGAYSWNGSSYSAEGGGVENLSKPYNVEHITVTAADIPMLGTTDFGEDLSYQQSACQPNCAIPHIAAFVLPHAGVSVGGYVSPAAYGQTCKSGCTNKLPYGARVRLRSSYTCPSASTYPQANLLCNQAKQYGWIFDDTVEVSNAGGIRLGVSSNGSNPWRSSDYAQFLANVKITDFQVMTLGTIH